MQQQSSRIRQQPASDHTRYRPRQAGSDPSRATIRTLARGLRLLELMGDAFDGATVTQLSARAGLDKATVSRLLATIREAGWAVQSPTDRRYRLAGKALALSHDRSNHVDVRVLAQAQLARLRERWNETVNLAIVEGGDVLYIDVDYSTAPVRVMSTIGQRMPLTKTALGQTFLSRMTGDELRALLAALEDAPKTAGELDAFMAELAACQERGYAIDDELGTPEVVCVGAPIIDVSGSPIASLSVTGPAYRMRPLIDDIGRSCIAAAAAVSAALGAPGYETLA